MESGWSDKGVMRLKNVSSSVFRRVAVGVGAALLLANSVTAGSERKPTEARGSNDRLDVVATVLLEPSDMHDALGADLESGYTIVRVKVTPKGDPLPVGPDDFTLLSRKDGDRAEALAPAQIGSKSALTVKRDTRGREWAQQTNQPGFSGIAGIKRDNSGKDDTALIDALKAKMLPEGEAKDAVEGLVYFALNTAKLKAKDLSLLYKGAGGRITIDFKAVSGPVVQPRPAIEVP
jgi:hypothetical protein